MSIPELQTPILLVAMPQVQDPFFHESVVLLIHHDEEGSVGLIVNRPTELKIADILHGLELEWGGRPGSLAYFGGPVQPQQGKVLYRGEVGAAETGEIPEIFPGIRTTQNLSDLAALATRPPAGLRLVLGYAGWGESQLLDEILGLAAQRLGRALAATSDRLLERHVGLGWLIGAAPGRVLAERDVLRTQPAVDVDVQQRRAVAKPPVTLDRIREHLQENLSIDQEDFETQPAFTRYGGWSRANKAFNSTLSELLQELNRGIAA